MKKNYTNLYYALLDSIFQTIIARFSQIPNVIFSKSYSSLPRRLISFGVFSTSFVWCGGGRVFPFFTRGVEIKVNEQRQTQTKTSIEKECTTKVLNLRASLFGELSIKTFQNALGGGGY